MAEVAILSNSSGEANWIVKRRGANWVAISVQLLSTARPSFLHSTSDKLKAPT